MAGESATASVTRFVGGLRVDIDLPEGVEDSVAQAIAVRALGAAMDFPRQRDAAAGQIRAIERERDPARLVLFLKAVSLRDGVYAPTTAEAAAPQTPTTTEVPSPAPSTAVVPSTGPTTTESPTARRTAVRR